MTKDTQTTQHNGQQHGEIILYQPDETVRLEVRLEDETVWLNRQQLAELFGRDVKTIGKHVNNALKEELKQTLADHQEKIDFFVRTNQPPVEGVLFEGQIFDAYRFVETLVKSAQREIIPLTMPSTTLELRSRTSANVFLPSN